MDSSLKLVLLGVLIAVGTFIVVPTLITVIFSLLAIVGAIAIARKLIRIDSSLEEPVVGPGESTPASTPPRP